MSAVLFAPHNDDETLFAFYTMLREKPHVVVVLRSFKQITQQSGPSYRVREDETRSVVCDLLGLTYEQWSHADTLPRWDKIAEAIELKAAAYDTVIAPAWEMGGHEDHNAVASICAGLKPQKLIRYLTYMRGHGRSEGGREVIPTDEERDLKMRALAAYKSQAAHPMTAPWFGLDQREWIA